MNVNSDEFREAVTANQQRLRSNLRPRYDFIVCGSGSWGIFPVLLRPHSAGRPRLTGAKFDDLIDSQILSHPADLIALRRCVELARDVGNAEALRSFAKREVMPTALASAAHGVTTVWHQSCTAKMGQDHMAVVDGRLKVYCVDRLRVSDASVMPRVPLGNTMAHCVIIGEQAARAIARRAGMLVGREPTAWLG